MFLPVIGEVRCDQPVHRVCFVQRAQLYVDGNQMRQPRRDMPGKLPQRKGLTAAEVAEHQDEPAVRSRQLLKQFIDEVVTGRYVRPVHVAKSLRDVQLRWVAGVGAEPDRLPGHIIAQIEQRLELEEAAHSYASPQRRG